jgi:WS/DGAT/MGAT family acyltransferase
METKTMESLSGLDASFLYLETPETPMHVGSLNLYSLPASFKGSFHRAVQEHIAKRMHLVPIFSRRIASMPLDMGHPAWVEIGKVDLGYHIRKVPGRALSVKQVQAVAAQLHSQLLDRKHPLWEFHVFDSVKIPPGMQVEGKLVALYSKFHHAALDGKAGTVLANAMLDLNETPREVPPPRARGKGDAPDLTMGEMIGGVISSSWAQYVKLAKSLPAAASSLGRAVAKQSLHGNDTGRGGLRPKSPVGLAPKTLFNVGISGDRAFAAASIPFAPSRAMAKAVNGSFNDIVLWLCSTALRTYLLNHDALPKKPLIAAMPVSLREDNNKELNTQATITAVDLGTHLANPMKRMNAILTSTAKVKDAMTGLKSVLPTDYPSLLAPWLVGGVGKVLFKTYGRAGVTERLPAVANVAISNVPGPQVPLYLAGARMLTFHPMSIVMHGLALNITIQTYAGSVDFGLVADKKAVPDIQELADGIEAAFEEAKGIFVSPEPATAPAKTAAAPRSKRPSKPPVKSAARPAARARRKAT